jgi:hypothetical protein
MHTRLAYAHASCHRVDAATIRGMYSLLRDTIRAARAEGHDR